MHTTRALHRDTMGLYVMIGGYDPETMTNCPQTNILATQGSLHCMLPPNSLLSRDPLKQ
jgi:hypothetical protein